MCNIYRGIQNTTYYVYYRVLCVTFIVEYKIQPIMCNIYRGIQNTTYYV